MYPGGEDTYDSMIDQDVTHAVNPQRSVDACGHCRSLSDAESNARRVNWTQLGRPALPGRSILLKLQREPMSG